MVVYRGTGKKVPGINKQHALTLAYREEINNKLKKGDIAYWEFLQTNSTKRLRDEAGARRELVAQCRRMATYKHMDKDGGVHTKFSGKGQHMKDNDDVFIAFAMCGLTPYMVMRDEGFCEGAHLSGILL